MNYIQWVCVIEFILRNQYNYDKLIPVVCTPVVDRVFNSQFLFSDSVLFVCLFAIKYKQEATANRPRELFVLGP